MSLCINPNCQKNNSLAPKGNIFCSQCGSNLIINGRYRVEKLIGEGGFAKTYLVLEGGKHKVLKTLLPSHTTNRKAVELFEQEAIILSRLNHSGIPKVESQCFTFIPKDNQQIAIHCFVMEKIEGADLEKWMESSQGVPISLDMAISWLRQLVEILDLIHKQQYYHRDIKHSNIMLRPNGQLVLIDFGAAREMTNTYMAKMAKGLSVTKIGSPGYIPPEQSNGKGVPQSDFFSLGRTFVYLLTGQSSMHFAESPTTGQMIWHSSVQSIPTLFLELIDQLMSPFVGNRPKNTEEILQKIKQIEIDIEKTISVRNNQNLYSSQSKNYSTRRNIFWAVPVSFLVFISIFIFNSLTRQSSEPIQVIKPSETNKLETSSPTPTPIKPSRPSEVVTKPPVKRDLDKKAVIKNPSFIQNDIQKKRNELLIQEQEIARATANQKAVEQRKNMPVQHKYEQERPIIQPKQEVANYRDTDVQITPRPVNIIPSKPVGNTPSVAPWDGNVPKTGTDELADVIRESNK